MKMWGLGYKIYGLVQYLPELLVPMISQHDVFVPCSLCVCCDKLGLLLPEKVKELIRMGNQVLTSSLN